MEEITKFKVDWKKIVVVGMLVVLSALVAGGATWYVSEMSKQAELDVKDNEIATLETKIMQLESELTALEEEEDVTTEQTTTTDDTTPTTTPEVEVTN